VRVLRRNRQKQAEERGNNCDEQRNHQILNRSAAHWLHHLTTIRRKFISPISACTQEKVPIKGKHEFFAIKADRIEQAQIVSSGSGSRIEQRELTDETELVPP
jgi:hypothetical protein